MPDLARLIVNRPKTTTNRNTNPPLIRITTPKPPTRATTMNSFWNEWSANRPTNLAANEIDRHSAHAHDSNETFRQTSPTTFVHTTTPKLESWMLDILAEFSSATTSTTTPTPQLQFNQIDHEYHTTPKVVDEMPAWMHNLFNEYSTTTTRKDIRFENDHAKQAPISGGNGGSHTSGYGPGGSGVNSNGDLHRPNQNRYSIGGS